MKPIGTTLLLAAAAALGMAWPLSGMARAGVVFETDFSGVSGTSVTSTTGGTATLTNSPYASIGTANPLAVGSGGYLQVAEPAGTFDTPGAGVEVAGTNSTPTNPVSSWIGTAVNSGADMNINGAFDFFFRPGTSQTGWTSKGFFFNFGGGTHELSLGLFTGTNGLKLSLSTLTTGSASGFTAGDLYHIAGVVTTNQTTGDVTVYLYAVAGDTTITTGSGYAASGSEAFLASSYTSDFGNTAFLFGGLSYSSTEPATTNGFDTLRIYNSVPTSFGLLAVPEPATLSLMALVGVGILLLPRRPQGV